MAIIKKTIIYKEDLLKLAKAKNLTLLELANKAKVNYQFLLRVAHEQQPIMEDTWNKIKKVLK